MASVNTVNKNTLRRWLREFERGERSKVEIERAELGNTTARGKVISRMWRQRLGVETVGSRTN